MPEVTIILPCRNEARHIERCLNSIFRQENPPGGFEVIVADGMSDDGTRNILKKFLDEEWRMRVMKSELGGDTSDLRAPCPVLRVIDNPQHIVSAGLNSAIRTASGRIIIRMDAHTEYGRDYVRQCVDVLRQTGADNVGGPWVAKGIESVPLAAAAAFQSPFSAGGARSHDPSYEGWVDTVYLGCWRREAFDSFGNFDEELVRNQDDEHNLRITRAGGKVYQSPKIRSWYYPRASLAALFKQYMQYGYWKVRIIQKHQLPASWRHLVPGAFLLTLGLLLVLSISCFVASTLQEPTAVGALTPGNSFRPLAVAGLASTCSLLLMVGAYTVSLLLASLLTAAKTQWKLLPLLPLVFWCYHFGYGFGFLRGFWDFVIRRKGASAWSSKLTRGEASTR